MERLDIKSMTLSELETALKPLSLPAFRAKQIYRWVRQGVTSFDEMSNLPKMLRKSLYNIFEIRHVKIKKRLESQVDDTVKYLYELYDGECIESVLMKYHHGYTVCISSQVGCRMGCSFCASGIDGLFRNLTAGEMLAQVEMAGRDNGVRISNVVMMGMGEPLDNFDQTVRFLELVGDEQGLNIGLRHVSVSTSGVVPNIYKLTELGYPVTLSISLHAPTDEIRDTIMKVNRAYPTDQLLAACRDHVQKTGRRISFEYALIDGVNDTEECALILAKRLKGMQCHVNLIPANPVKENSFTRPNEQKVRQFCDKLCALGLNTTVRRTLGADIDASCGQLRRKHCEA